MKALFQLKGYYAHYFNVKRIPNIGENISFYEVDQRGELYDFHGTVANIYTSVVNRRSWFRRYTIKHTVAVHVTRATKLTNRKED